MKTVITLGPKGSYHSLAAKKIHKNCTIVYVNSFNEILTKLFKNSEASAVIAVHNSITGVIVDSEKLLKKYRDKISVVSETPLDIKHSLIALKKSNLLAITTVISHPQALKQCSKFIKEHKLKTMFSSSTTSAIQKLLQLKDPKIAAIAPHLPSAQTKILRKNIQNKANNVTTFLEIGVKLEVTMQKLLAKRVKKLADPTVVNTLKHAANPEIVSLGGGIPNPNLFPKKEIKQVISQILENDLDTVLQYSITAGIPQLREEIATYYSQKWGRKISTDNILITSGSQQGIDLMGKAFLDDSRDAIIVENPTYLVAISAFNTYNPTYITIETNNGQPNLDQLELLLEKHKNIKFLYAIPTFQNPTGGTWNEHTRIKVLQLIQKYKILFLEDDPYGELYFDSEPPKSLMCNDTSDSTVYLGTFSKTLVPGLRVGFVITSKELITTLTLIKQSMDLHSPVLSQLIVARLLAKKNFYTNHLDKLRKYYKENARYMLQLLEENLSDHATWNIPEGGLFIWLTLKKMSCKNIFTKAIEKKVAFMPGYPFYANNSDEYTLRLTFSTANKKQMEDAIKKLKSCF